MFYEGIKLDRELRRKERAAAAQAVGRVGQKAGARVEKAANGKHKGSGANGAPLAGARRSRVRKRPNKSLTQEIASADLPTTPTKKQACQRPKRTQDTAALSPSPIAKRWSGARTRVLVKGLREAVAQANSTPPAPSTVPKPLSLSAVPAKREVQQVKMLYASVKSKVDVTCGADGRYGMTGHVNQASLTKLLAFLREKVRLLHEAERQTW